MSRMLLALAVFLAAPTFLPAQSLQGVWRGTEVEVVNGPDAGVQVLEFPRLLIYTDSHYTWQFVVGTEPRPLGDSDAEVAQAARQYASSTGTYIRDGAEIIYNQLVTGNPNNMLPENQPAVRTIRLLTPAQLETQATNEDSVTTILRYERVE